mgnify:CR=1 FL=1
MELGLAESGLVGSGLAELGLVGSGLVGSGLVELGLVGSGLVGSGLVESGLELLSGFRLRSFSERAALGYREDCDWAKGTPPKNLGKKTTENIFIFPNF